MSASRERKPAERVWSRLPAGTERGLREDLSPTDLQSLLLDVSRARAAAVTPARLLHRWRDDRFVHPATTDPRILARATAQLWECLPATVDGVDLSPVAPLGTCAAVASVDQNRIVSTVRGSEVVSDPTNVLALAAAEGRRAGQPRVDLAAAHRVLRGQKFSAPGAQAHFLLFALVSSARDRGSLRTEAELLIDQLHYWELALATLAPGVPATVALTAFDASARPLVADLLTSWSSPTLTAVEDVDRTRAAGYYDPVALRIELAGEEIGDGGFVRWTATLMNDAKERCLISCIAVERLLSRAADPDHG
ncbi:MAG: hypothetical protein ABWY56_01190 [Propionibacteriaceae bacterium]